VTDIVNGIGIIRAIQSARSVRPVLLLSRLDFPVRTAKGLDDLGTYVIVFDVSSLWYRQVHTSNTSRIRLRTSSWTCSPTSLGVRRQELTRVSLLSPRR
jgi:hypothetical protein